MDSDPWPKSGEGLPVLATAALAACCPELMSGAEPAWVVPLCMWPGLA